MPIFRILFLLLLSTAAGLLAAAAMPQAFSVAIRIAEEEAVTVVVRESEVASYRNLRHGESFGIVIRAGKTAGAVEVQLVDLAGEIPYYGVERVLGTIGGRLAAEPVVVRGGRRPIEVDVRKAVGFEAREPCAVVCDDVEVAGRAVQTPCGQCIDRRRSSTH